MTEEIKKCIVSITLTNTIEVDACIAKEIEFLNNMAGIQTIYSCCGHGSGGYIIAHPDCVEDMKKLKYKSDGKLYATRFDEDDRYLIGHLWLLKFIPKSKCKCKGDK